MAQRFDRVCLLNECAFPRNPHRAHRIRDGNCQEQSIGNQTSHDDSHSNAIDQGRMVERIGQGEQELEQQHHHQADPHHAVDLLLQGGKDASECPGAGCKLVRGALRSPCWTKTERPRKHTVALLLRHQVDSPVSSASSTSAARRLTTVPSATIWSPAVATRRSPRTTSVGSTQRRNPSRRTVTAGRASTAMRSRTCLAWIS